MSEPEFHSLIDDLSPRVLHGQADAAARAELARLLSDSPANRRRFLDHAALHAMLAEEAKAGAFADDAAGFFQKAATSSAGRPRRHPRLWFSAAAAVAVACIVAVMLLPVSASSALDRVITSMGNSQDRAYQIEVLEPADAGAVPRSDRGRFPAASYLEGATLWLRGPGEFVLRQALPNGEIRFLGSDGAESWSIRAGEPARVSDDPERFGGGVLAKRTEFAMFDLRGQLGELKALYHLTWLDRSGHGTWKLRGSRKSDDQGGPREVELWFDSDSGLLQRMIFRQLPRANGGPRSIAVVLQSTRPLPADFFRSSHPRTSTP